MIHSTPRRIREAAQHHVAAVQATHGATGRRLSALGSGRRLPLSERDQLLLEVVTSYRAGDRNRWGAVLLDVMAPTITTRLHRFSPAGPVADTEDIAQELLLAVLEVALTIDLQAGRYLERHLLLRAAARVSYRLERESERQALLDPLSVLGGEEDGESEDDDR